MTPIHFPLPLCLLAALLAGCGPGDDAQTSTPGQALLEVAEQGDLATLNDLLRRHPRPDVRDHCDWTPLMKAALVGHRAVVARLLDAGAAVDAADTGSYTALLLAASNDHADVVELLLERGAMIDHQETTEGLTALLWAAHKGHAATVAVLLRRGADRTLRDFKGRTAADAARDSGSAAVLALLAPGVSPPARPSADSPPTASPGAG